MAAGALSYPQWVRGFTQRFEELEITAASRGGKSVSVVWWGDSGGREYPAAELPLQHPLATQPWHIRISYLAQRNAAAQDTEVRLLEVSSPEPIVWTEFSSGPIWKQRPNNLGFARQSLAARGNTPGAVDIERTGGTLTLQFEKHKLGGLVQIAVNGESRTLDLYSAETGVETLTWQPDPAAETVPAKEVLRARISNPPGRLRNLRLSVTPAGRGEIRSAKLDGVPLSEVSAGVFAAPDSYWTSPARALTASLGTWLAVAAVVFLLTLLWSRGAEASRTLERATAVLSAIAISAFWTAVYYPALMSDDSFDMWAQAIEGVFNKWHPIGMTIVMRVVHLALSGHSMEFQVALVAFIQGTLLWCAIFAAVSLVAPPGRKRMAACIVMALYYPLWPYTITLWKDVWFAMAWIGLLCWSKPVLTGEAFTWRRLGGAAAFLGLALLSRKTAGVVFLSLAAGSVLTLFCLSRRVQARRAAVSAALIFLAGMLLDVGVNRLVRARGAGNDLNYYMSWELVGTLHFTGKPIERFEQLQTYHAVGKGQMARAVSQYACNGTSEYLVWSTDPPFDVADLTGDSYAIQDMPLLVLGFATAWVRHRICAVESLVQFPGREIHQPFWFPVLPNRFGIAGGTRLPAVQEAVQHGLLEPAVSRPGPLQFPYRHVLLLMAAGLVSLLVLAVKWFQRAGPLPMMPVYLFAGGFAVLLPYLFLSPGGDWRYLMPANLCWMVSTLGALASAPRDDEPTRHAAS
jgi:hypothetical protein